MPLLASACEVTAVKLMARNRTVMEEISLVEAGVFWRPPAAPSAAGAGAAATSAGARAAGVRSRPYRRRKASFAAASSALLGATGGGNAPLFTSAAFSPPSLEAEVNWSIQTPVSVRMVLRV